MLSVSAVHPENINAPPDARKTPLLVLNLDSLSDTKFLGGQRVESDADIAGEIFDVNRENVAFRNWDPRGSEKRRAHTDRILNIFAGRLEYFVRDDALGGPEFNGAEEDEPDHKGKSAEDCGET